MKGTYVTWFRKVGDLPHVTNLKAKLENLWPKVFVDRFLQQVVAGRCSLYDQSLKRAKRGARNIQVLLFVKLPYQILHTI